jgi:hypothetical protein
MKKINYYIIGAVALLGGGYLAYKKGWFGNPKKDDIDDIKTPDDIGKEQKKEQINDALIVVANEANKAINSIGNKNSYISKVAVIQKDIGVTPDGIVGKNTLQALDKKYGLSKGNLSPLNVDYYLELVKKNATKIKRSIVKKSSQNEQTIEQALKNGGTLQMVNNENSKQYKFNAILNKLEVIKNVRVRNFKKGEKLTNFTLFKSTSKNNIYVQRRGIMNEIYQIPIKKVIVI